MGWWQKHPPQPYKYPRVRLQMIDYWRPPRMWPESTVYLIGGGPSLSLLDLTRIHSRRVIGCNDAYQLGTWVDVCLFGDRHWYSGQDGFEGHKAGLDAWGGLKVNTHEAFVHHKGILVCKRVNNGFDMRPHTLTWNRSTGAMAINLAAKFGAGTIVLLGYDMRVGSEGQSNWHPNMKDKPNASLYNCFTARIEEKVAPAVEKLGIRVVNANPDSALECFEKMTYEEALNL